MKAPLPYWLSLPPSGQGSWDLLQVWEGGCLGCTCTRPGRCGATVFLVPGWIQYCLRVFYFVSLPFPGPLARNSGLFLCWGFFPFFVCTHWCFWVATFLSSKCGIHGVKRNPENSSPCVSLLGSWDSLASLLSPLCLLESFNVCFVGNAQEFQLRSVEGLGEGTSVPFSWKWKFHS